MRELLEQFGNLHNYQLPVWVMETILAKHEEVMAKFTSEHVDVLNQWARNVAAERQRAEKLVRYLHVWNSVAAELAQVLDGCNQDAAAWSLWEKMVLNRFRAHRADTKDAIAEWNVQHVEQQHVELLRDEKLHLD